MMERRSVLMLGGSGQAGADTAALLRRWYPTLPLTIAGRDLDRARRVADRLGAATAVRVDLERGDLGRPADETYSAVVAALWDERLHGLRYAQRRGLPYLSISSGPDIAPEVVMGAQGAGAGPILLASHWCAGAVTLVVAHLAREFERVDAVRIGAVLDERDTGGPAGIADLERWSAITSAGLVRRDGVFTWLPAADARVEVVASDGTAVPGAYIAILDVPSIALATDAPNVHFAFAVGTSTGSRRGGPASLEVRVDIEGTAPGGAPLRTGRYLTHAAGQRPLTALGMALGVERLLALRGDPVPPGIHTPEALVDPAYAVERMLEGGAVLTEAPGAAG
ncbi:saccharopine dehydrogenase [Streptomyces sp. 71268]|uniref:saccharopine dehydrogenase n=1 Tax=Streptomyces sp. 71268 TaxID=3002640 RepID=UPI0023F811E6|nr:saccharopine dehydrogenase [Streptomyces sp. 71268]WEV28486.1 saccharopine dehydrogenase [Streptomyces sp. 71268]